MKYYIKIMGLLSYLTSIAFFIVTVHHEGQERMNYLILGVLFLLLAKVNMLEQTIINNLGVITSIK